jgi:hypothetical protein
MEMNAVLQFLDAERNEEEGAESIRVPGSAM